MFSSKILWISVMTSMAIIASTSAENAMASYHLVDEEEAVEAGNATMMTNQTAANGNMTGTGTNSTS